MAINFTNGYTYLGRLAAAFINCLREGGTTAPYPVSGCYWGNGGAHILDQGTMYSEVDGVFNSTGITGDVPTSQLLPALLNMDNTLIPLKSAAIQDMKAVITTIVQNDNPQPTTDFSTIMIEWIRQMKAQTVTVNKSTVGSSVTAGANNTGNPGVVIGLTDQNGYSLEYAVPETILLRCTADSYTGGTNPGSETISVAGLPTSANTSVQFLQVPGSGVQQSITVVDPTQGNGGGQNMLTGGTGTTAGAFKAWNGSTPVQWVVDVDATNVADGTSDNYAGTAHCLSFVGNTGGTNLQTAVYQPFANGSPSPSGSSLLIAGQHVYVFAMRLKVKVVPAAGAISISLTDGSGTVLTDNAGNANTITQSLTGLSNNTYVLVSGTFRTPNLLPANVRLRIKATTPITTGSTCYMDYVALFDPQQGVYGGIYAGGPFVGIFRGSTDCLKWVNYLVGDTWNVPITNSLFSSLAPSFQMVAAQMLQLPQLGLVLPSNVSPSISDGLIL
jgi:hypothetical protein